MHLNLPQTIALTLPPLVHRKTHLPRNWPLVPKRLETAVLDSL